MIAGVLRETAGRPEIEIHLAIGGACIAVSKWEREIWLDEVHVYDRWLKAPPAERVAAIEAVIAERAA